MVNQFWKNTDLNGRDRTDLKQFETIGEIFEPMTCMFALTHSLACRIQTDGNLRSKDQEAPDCS